MLRLNLGRLAACAGGACWFCGRRFDVQPARVCAQGVASQPRATRCPRDVLACVRHGPHPPPQGSTCRCTKPSSGRWAWRRYEGIQGCASGGRQQRGAGGGNRVGGGAWRTGRCCVCVLHAGAGSVGVTNIARCTLPEVGEPRMHASEPRAPHGHIPSTVHCRPHGCTLLRHACMHAGQFSASPRPSACLVAHPSSIIRSHHPHGMKSKAPCWAHTCAAHVNALIMTQPHIMRLVMTSSITRTQGMMSKIDELERILAVVGPGETMLLDEEYSTSVGRAQALRGALAAGGAGSLPAGAGVGTASASRKTSGMGAAAPPPAVTPGAALRLALERESAGSGGSGGGGGGGPAGDGHGPAASALVKPQPAAS